MAAAEDAEIAKFGGEDALAGEGSDGADHGFDFGKFGHLGNLDGDVAEDRPGGVSYKEFGHLGYLDVDIAGFEFDFESGHAFGGVVIVLAGGAIEFPEVVGADDGSAVDLTLAERSAAMDADATEGANGSAGMANGIGLIAHHHFHDGIRGKLRQGGHFEERHLHIVR